MDTPGILWPKFEDQEVGRRLAFIGSMNDEILLKGELACDLIKVLRQLYPDALSSRYDIELREKSRRFLRKLPGAENAIPRGKAWIWRRLPLFCWRISGAADWEELHWSSQMKDARIKQI